MGLDMYSYSVPRDVYEGEVDFVVSQQEDADSELHYWRKHNALHAWMENLYRAKLGQDEDFNCVNVNLDASDIEKLETDIKNSQLPESVNGFFFGNDSRIDYESERKEEDLKFVEAAKHALADGRKVYYTSWW